MTRQRKVPDDRLLTLVEAGRGTWRATALNAAIAQAFGCHPRHARLVMASALKRGIINKQDGYYGVPTAGARPAESADGLSPPAFTVPKPSPSQFNRGTGHWHSLRRRELLTLMKGRSWLSVEIERVAYEKFGSSDATVRNTLQYAVGYGYLRRTEDRRYHVTPLAESQLDRYGQLEGVEGVHFARFCAGKPGRLIRRE